MRPLAYHITWGTYGTRLRYGPRPTVSRDQNDFGAPVLAYDQHLWEREKGNLKYPPVLLDRDQMRFIESMIPALCERGRWTLRTCAAGPDHVHKVLTSDQNPDTIRRLLKRWLGRALCDRYPLDGRRAQLHVVGRFQQHQVVPRPRVPRERHDLRHRPARLPRVTPARPPHEPACPHAGPPPTLAGLR